MHHRQAIRDGRAVVASSSPGAQAQSELAARSAGAPMMRRVLAGVTAAAVVLPTTSATRPERSASAVQGTDTSTSMFEINGLRVILRRNTANDVVASNLYLLGGTKQLSPATQGIEGMLLAAAGRGAEEYT